MSSTAQAKKQRVGFIWQLLDNRKASAGAALLLFFVLMGLCGPSLVPVDPAAFVGPPHQPPSSEYLFGTTGQGQDVLAQTIAGARTSLAVGFAELVAADPTGITDAQFAVLREEFTDEEIVELVAWITLVSISGQMFGAVLGLEAASPEEADEYQQAMLNIEAQVKAKAAAAS